MLQGKRGALLLLCVTNHLVTERCSKFDDWCVNFLGFKKKIYKVTETNKINNNNEIPYTQTHWHTRTLVKVKFGKQPFLIITIFLVKDIFVLQKKKSISDINLPLRLYKKKKSVSVNNWFKKKKFHFWEKHGEKPVTDVRLIIFIFKTILFSLTHIPPKETYKWYRRDRGLPYRVHMYFTFTSHVPHFYLTCTQG